ncbi:MAG: LysE family translocator [Paracoccus sp. (in: a-proteobacteria)]|uniref:LysE family translocator n=1 Tax=Paracoccus sp. TaxID=267 RepID=UPI0039E242DE
MIWDTLANFPVQQLLTFLAGVVVLSFVPGQDVFFASACGIQNGPRAGALAGLGVGLGLFCHVAMTTAGLGALLAALPGALAVVKYLGAGYLLYLAWKSWHSAGDDPRAAAPRSRWSIIRRGALSNLLNPKPILFLLAFLPQFTRAEYGPIWQQILALGLIAVGSVSVVTMGYGILAGYAGQMIGRRLGTLNRLASVMFAGLAARLVWK